MDSSMTVYTEDGTAIGMYKQYMAVGGVYVCVCVLQTLQY